MKVLKITLLLTLALISNLGFGQDTMYVWKDGTVVTQFNVQTEVDSITFYYSSSITDTTEVLSDTTGTFTDARDFNKYKWVKIGDQIWMAENLRYLPIVHKADQDEEDVINTYYYVYNNSSASPAVAKLNENYNTHGVLYSWTAAMAGHASVSTNPSGVQGACPINWHLPSDAEWTELIDHLGGSSVAGDKLKATGTDYWESPSAGTNETGFNAFGSGKRDDFPADYLGLGTMANWWSATQYSSSGAWFRRISNYGGSADRYGIDKWEGFSVRCVKD